MGLERPPDYVPPPLPSARDVARTLRTLATSLVPTFARLALRRAGSLPTTATAEGLALVRASAAPTLRRLGVELEVRFAERVAARGGLILFWNQESHLDHLVLASAVPRPFFSLYNNEIARFPFYGQYMRAGGHVHVNRNDEAQWRPSIARAAERVRAGECVLVSPEGTRSWGAPACARVGAARRVRHRHRGPRAAAAGKLGRASGPAARRLRRAHRFRSGGWGRGGGGGAPPRRAGDGDVRAGEGGARAVTVRTSDGASRIATHLATLPDHRPDARRRELQLDRGTRFARGVV